MKLLAFIKTLVATCALAASACAQAAYPTKPVTLVLGFAPGGISDGLVRQIAEFARETRSANVIIEYRPGASSTIAAGMIKRAAPDGYTVHLMSPSAMQVLPNLQTLPYDPLTDFTYVGMVLAQPQPMYVLDSAPFRSFGDVLAFARAHPGQFTWGTAGVNNLAQILVQSAFAKEGVETVPVSYKGGSEAITALLGGHIQAVVSTDFGPLLADGRVRLVVETGERKAIDDVQTLKELGYPLTATLQYGIVGPAGMDPAAVAWWDALLRDFAQSDRVKAFARQYYSVPVYASPADTADEVARGYRELGEAIEALGLKGQ